MARPAFNNNIITCFGTLRKAQLLSLHKPFQGVDHAARTTPSVSAHVLFQFRAAAGNHASRGTGEAQGGASANVTQTATRKPCPRQGGAALGPPSAAGSALTLRAAPCARIAHWRIRGHGAAPAPVTSGNYGASTKRHGETIRLASEQTPPAVGLAALSRQKAPGRTYTPLQWCSRCASRHAEGARTNCTVTLR